MMMRIFYKNKQTTQRNIKFCFHTCIKNCKEIVHQVIHFNPNSLTMCCNMSFGMFSPFRKAKTLSSMTFLKGKCRYLEHPKWILCIRLRSFQCFGHDTWKCRVWISYIVQIYAKTNLKRNILVAKPLNSIIRNLYPFFVSLHFSKTH